jgi:hypoxanthine-guanine phosphoribosyltransferase
MNTFILKDSVIDESINAAIEVCKSSSMIMGRKLRAAHYELGKTISGNIYDNSISNKYAVLILMRAGLNFGSGIADELEIKGASVTMIFVHNDIVATEDLNLVLGKQIIIVDAVINSGQSIFGLLAQLPEIERNSAKIITTVIPSKSLSLFKDHQLYTVRSSENAYKGAKVSEISGGRGPDTGDRLFNTY